MTGVTSGGREFNNVMIEKGIVDFLSVRHIFEIAFGLAREGWAERVIRRVVAGIFPSIFGGEEKILTIVRINFRGYGGTPADRNLKLIY